MAIINRKTRLIEIITVPIAICNHNKSIFFFFAVASFANDVYLDPLVGRVRVHFRGTRRVGVRTQSNSRPVGSRHHRTGVFPADIRRVPTAPGFVQKTDFQLDPLVGRQRRPYIFK